jgi:hypothetical protein
MPLGLGKVVIFDYIEVVLGLLVVNDIEVEGFRVLVPQGTEDEFWRGIDQNRPTKFPTTAFLTKAIRTARMSRQRLTKK